MFFFFLVQIHLDKDEMKMEIRSILEVISKISEQWKLFDGAYKCKSLLTVMILTSKNHCYIRTSKFHTIDFFL